jgi:hypothetical protein
MNPDRTVWSARTERGERPRQSSERSVFLMLKLLVKIPLAIVYAIGIVLMIVCSAPFIAVGFIAGFIKFAWGIGMRLSDRAYLHFS